MITFEWQFCLFLSISCVVQASEILRPRGVPLTKKVFYDPLKDFSCLDGSGTFPFSHVNDDYCDCEDGSDEPGTAACPNGVFHCPNVGYIEKNIRSNRVNDKICDCCDGSDEYGPTGATCPNTCHALGERYREERRQYLEQLKKGSEVRGEYIQQSKERKEKDSMELSQLKAQLSELESIKAEKDAVRRAAEEKEKEVLDKIREEQEAKKKEQEEAELKKQEEEDRKEAELAFHELDSDDDGILTFEELKQHINFDRDHDGQVSDEEAKFFLHMKDNMDLEEFLSVGWDIAKPYYLGEKSVPPPPPPVADAQEVNEADDVITASPLETHDHDHDHDEHQDFDDDEDDPSRDYPPPPEFPTPNEAPDLPRKSGDTEPEYDEETKKLMDEAKKAKDEFREAEGKYLDVHKRIQELEGVLNTDFGPEDAFMALHGQCIEMTDREYIYKLCPFDRASQRPKDGGSETSLGRWGRWTGGETSKYSRQKYEGGATCWNGPARSVEVNMKCGLSNELLSAAEPNRCEYSFEFKTPSACVIEGENLVEGVDQLSHDEL